MIQVTSRDDAIRRLRAVEPKVTPYLGRLLNLTKQALSDERRNVQDQILRMERFGGQRPTRAGDELRARLQRVDDFEELIECLLFLYIERDAKTFAAAMGAAGWRMQP